MKTQVTDLLLGARNAYKYFQSQFPNPSFRVALKSDGGCGKGWFKSPSELTILSAIAVVGDNKNLMTYRITSINPEWTQFSSPELIAPGPWLGVSGYDPTKVDYQEAESFTNLQKFLTANNYNQVQYTQVSLVSQAYPPYRQVYAYDIDLAAYGFGITQYITVPQAGDVGQANEIGYCPLPIINQ